MIGRRIRLIEPAGSRTRLMSAWLSRWPLLGTITLGTLLARRGFDVAIYNENLTGSVLDDVAAMDDLKSADVIGISIMTPTAPRGYQIARAIRQMSGALLVFGGPHATFMADEAARFGDVVVCGEGETVIEPIARGEIAAGIVQAPPLEDLDSLPPLDHSLVVGFDRLVRSATQTLYELPVMSSRGCPYGCTYCSVTRLFGRQVRRQSVEKVCADIDAYRARGFGRFIFYDDNFTSDRRWCKELCGRLRQRRIRFNVQTRVDFHWADRSRTTSDSELLDLMRSAGAEILYIGYETLDEQTAATWNKGYSRGRLGELLARDTQVLHDWGFWVHAMFVLGPQHTEAVADGIIEFSRANRLESIQVAALTPFPGTPLFAQSRDNLLFTNFPDDWSYYDGTHCLYRKCAMGLEGYQRKLLELHERFYRWGGASLRRARQIMREPVSLWLRLKNLWSNAKIARQTLARCRADMVAYLELARQRLMQTIQQSAICRNGGGQ